MKCFIQTSRFDSKEKLDLNARLTDEDLEDKKLNFLSAKEEEKKIISPPPINKHVKFIQIIL